MIKSIKIKDVASYGAEGVEINLGKVNYIYGSNGTGKTTITEYLRTNTDLKFSSCNIEWQQSNMNGDMFVYNRHFVNENFNIQNEIKGIFTLGKESTKVLADIEEMKTQGEKHKEKINKLVKNKEEKEDRLNDLKIDFTTKSWDFKLKFDEQFKDAFTGLRNNRERFMLRCLKEAEENDSNLYTYEELKKRVESVFQGSKNKFSPIQEIKYDATVEENSLFKTRIIGKED